MIVYVDTKSGKVDLTKAELEKLLKAKYDEGYKDGKKFCGSVTYSCPYNYGGCPYWYKWSNSPYTWTTTTSAKTITGNTANSTIGVDSIFQDSTTGTITFKEK